MTHLMFLSINRPDLLPLTLNLALLTCHHDNHHHPHRNEMSMLGHAHFLNQPIRGLDSRQVMINRFALSLLCIELDRTRNVQGHRTLHTTLRAQCVHNYFSQDNHLVGYAEKLATIRKARTQIQLPASKQEATK